MVDGQQRITTILILLCALRDTMTDEDPVSNVKQFLVNSTNDDKYRMRLKQTSYDSETFIDLINKNLPKNPNNNIYRNYLDFVVPEGIFDTLKPLQIVGSI